ncbi:MAG: hypothetical protein BA863_18635 [Desulfovibrio sp. S3730MH75]|nr:MAG: hypothetical protein BA863_18635 [Desulfovibrio sp. S3730MH75]
MGKRHPNHRLVKVHRNYTVDEIAELLGVHKNTVRNWLRSGLDTIDSRRPMLVLGRTLKAFLQLRRQKNKQQCNPGELYCVRCRVPRTPAGNMADYYPDTEKVGNLVAICPVCNSIINRRVSLAKIGAVSGDLEITFPEELQHIGKISKPTVNSYFRKDGSGHEEIQSR